jgi:hypothetical protein
MLRSAFCILYNLAESDLHDLNECPYDQGGYFIINGSEKVLIAQERMATNHVYVFAKAQPSPISFLAEIRSAVEKGGKTISQFQVKMYHRNQDKSVRIIKNLDGHHSLSFREAMSSRRRYPTSSKTFLSGSCSVLSEWCQIETSSNTSAMTCKTCRCWKCSSHALMMAL